ncbi:hypothetical protein [Staphylococcus aureus]|uniref:hypothetical protein n=1 Tax=Staphylococcus aureus TaxID=1280 RepID=UPI0011A5F313|nr:hypothetical protein [Staphylococcus aureus]
MKGDIGVGISGRIYNEGVIKEGLDIGEKEDGKLSGIYIDVLEKKREYKGSEKQVDEHVMVGK